MADNPLGAFGGLDPSIPAGFKPPQAAANTDPLSLMSGMADTQNKLNQIRLFQQTWAARQKAGQIMSKAPSMEAGLDELMKDPLTAPFAGDMVKSAREAMLAQQQYMNEQQTGNISGLGQVLKGLGAGLADPKSLPKVMDAYLKTLSPVAQKAVGPAAKAAVQAMIDDLPEDPTQARAVYNQRMTGLMMGAGFDKGSIEGILGTPTTRDTGGTIESGVQMPAQLGGGFAPSGAPAIKGVAPTVQTLHVGPQGTETPAIVGGGGGTPVGGQEPPNPMVEPLAGVSGPTQAQAKANEAGGAAAGGMAEDMMANAAGLPMALKRINLMTDALGQFQAGGGADFRASMAKGLQALRNAGVTGISEDTINKVANSNLSATQLFNAEVKPLVIGELKQAAQGTGRVMRSEVDAFLGMMDNTTDPKTLMTLLNQARFALQVGYDQTQKYTDFKQMIAKKDPSVAGLDLQDFPMWYVKNYDPTKLPEATGGGLSLAPVSPEKAMGAQGAGAPAAGGAPAKYRLNPKTRRLEPIQ